MDKTQRNTKTKVKKIPTNGIIEEDGKAYILCGSKKILLKGGYQKIKKQYIYTI